MRWDIEDAKIVTEEVVWIWAEPEIQTKTFCRRELGERKGQQKKSDDLVSNDPGTIEVKRRFNNSNTDLLGS